MRIVIIGAVAAGTSAGAKARRNDESAEIVIYEMDSFISYAGCGTPYYIGGKVDSVETLAPRDPAFFKTKYNIDVFIKHEVLSIDSKNKTLEVKELSTGNVFTDKYDKLVISTGATSTIPPIKGMDQKNVFTLRNIVDMNRIKAFLYENKPKTAIIIGTGFIGLEVCENLKGLGINVTMVERLPQVTPGLDQEMAVYVEEHLIKSGVKVITGVTATEISGNKVNLDNGSEIEGEFILVSVGVKPNTNLAVKAGVDLGVTKAIKVNEKMMTNIEDIYACGDCIEQYNLITGKPIYRALGSTANKTGRIAGENISGGNIDFRGILGTGIFKVFGMSVAVTGFSEQSAKTEGYEVVICHNKTINKPEYMGGQEMVIKGIADAKTGRLLGAQIIGYEGVDKRIDVLATAITFKANVEDLFHLDLAYSPPFSLPKDPVMLTGMILEGEIEKYKKGKS